MIIMIITESEKTKVLEKTKEFSDKETTRHNKAIIQIWVSETLSGLRHVELQGRPVEKGLLRNPSHWKFFRGKLA